MAVIDIVAAAAAANSSQGGLVAANNLRIASIAIAAYEYVVSSFLLTLVVTYTLQLTHYYHFRNPAIQDYKST